MLTCTSDTFLSFLFKFKNNVEYSVTQDVAQQTDLKIMAIPVPQSSYCWGYRHMTQPKTLCLYAVLSSLESTC